MDSSTDHDHTPGAGEEDDAHNGEGSGEAIPRPKRIACVLCRKRKLKCDGYKPSCGTCSRLKHHCEYSEERKKSGPKRGYVKLLEARLKQVENLLESRDTPRETGPSTAQPSRAPGTYGSGSPTMDVPPFEDTSIPGLMQDGNFTDPALGVMNDFPMNTEDDFSWEMIGLGLEEALPPRDVVDELNEIYFEKVHPTMPMIHKARFLASMDLTPYMRPPACLRYSIFLHACSVTSKYSAYTELFYARARKYAEMDELKGHGESMVTLAHCQAWVLLSAYEFKLMYFPRAWMSVGRAARMAQMMGLHRQDRVGLDVKQTLPPPRDWTEREERRRTFWVAYCHDRYASMGTGWPMCMDELDILTNLPASEEAFNQSRPEPTLQLSDLLNGDGASSMSSFAGMILLSTLYGRNLTHLHRPEEHDNDHDLNGAFWKRHRALDNILLHLSLSLPAHLRLPAGINDPNTVFLNMNIHTATICLHQAAIFKADKNHLPAQISAESKRRCIVAADQITNTMKICSHRDMSTMSPFFAFCLYVAARVFVQYLKARRDDAAVISSLHFLLAAMQILKGTSPITESFLVQLDVDLEGTGLDIPNTSRWKFGHRPPGEVPANTDSLKCSPLFEIRESQQGPIMNGVIPPPSNPEGNASTSSSSYPDLYASGGSSSAGYTAQTGPLSMNTFELPVQSIGNDTSPEGTGTGSGTGSGSRSQSNHPTPSSLSQQNSSSASYPSPRNPTFGGPSAHPASHSQQLSPGFGAMPNGGDGWNPINPQNQPDTTTGSGAQAQQNLTFGSTGMTPLQESIWPAAGLEEGNDWMFGWPESTPQPQ